MIKKIIQKTFLVIVQHISTLLCTGTGWKAGEALPGVAHTTLHYTTNSSATEYHSTDTIHTLVSTEDRTSHHMTYLNAVKISYP